MPFPSKSQLVRKSKKRVNDLSPIEGKEDMKDIIVFLNSTRQLIFYHDNSITFITNDIREFFIEKQSPLEVSIYWLTIRPPFRDWFRSSN